MGPGPKRFWVLIRNRSSASVGPFGFDLVSICAARWFGLLGVVVFLLYFVGRALKTARGDSKDWNF